MLPERVVDDDGRWIDAALVNELIERLSRVYVLADDRHPCDAETLAIPDGLGGGGGAAANFGVAADLGRVTQRGQGTAVHLGQPGLSGFTLGKVRAAQLLDQVGQRCVVRLRGGLRGRLRGLTARQGCRGEKNEAEH